MTHTSAHNSGPSPRDGERSLQPHSADAADVFFREAGLTPAAITRLTEKKQGSAIAEIIVSGKLSRSAARELSEAIKRDEAPLSLESAKLLAQICSVELSARRPDESLHDQRKREELAFDHVVKLIVRTYEKELAEDAGKDNPRTRLLSRLDNKALQDLFACVSRGPGHAEIALKVLRDVSVTSPTGEGQALSILNTHRGDWMILDRVLTTVADTHDILLASKRVQVLFASEDMRREYAAQQRGQLGNEREDYSREEPSMRESIALASGVVSTSNDLYCFMNIGKPDQSVFLGNFATPHLAETLFSGKYQGKTIERRKEERQRRSKALFEDVTLGDLLEDPKLVQEIGSPLIGRALQVYKDLISEQQRLRQEILSEIQNISPKETLEFLATMQLRADDPKYLIGRARTAIQENPESVSEIVRTAFNNLQSPYTELGIDASNPAQQNQLESACMKTLALWLAHVECVRTDLAFKQHLDDVAEWKKLNQNDPLRAKHSKLGDLEPILREIQNQRQVITRAEYGSILLSHDLLGFRREMNERLWAQMGETVLEASARFRPLFMDRNRWREDCIPLAVPNRVLNSFWGAKLGIDPEEGGERHSTVSRAEFRALLRFELLRSACPKGNDQSQLFRAASVAEFRTILRMCAYAHKKADALDKHFSSFNAERREKGLPEVELNSPLDVSDKLPELESFKPRLVTRSIATDKDAMGVAEEINALLPLPLEELGRRLAYKPPGVLDGRKDPSGAVLRRIANEAQSGVYSHEFQRTILHIAPQLVGLIEQNDPQLKSDLKHARRISSAVLVTRIEFPGVYSSKPDFAGRFYTPEQAQVIHALASEVGEFRRLQLHRSKSTAEIRAQYDQYTSYSFYRGEFSERTLKFEMIPATAIFTSVMESPGKTFQYLDPGKLGAAVARVTSEIKAGEWIAASELPKEWFEKARRAVSYEGARELGYRGSDKDVFFSMRNLSQHSRVYISREFVDAVNNIETLAKASDAMPVRMTGFVGYNERFEWKEGELLVNFTNAQKGKPVIDVAFGNAGFFTSWVPNQNRYEPFVTEIGQEAVKMIIKEFPLSSYPRIKDTAPPFDSQTRASLNRRLAEYIASNWRRWYPRKESAFSPNRK